MKMRLSFIVLLCVAVHFVTSEDKCPETQKCTRPSVFDRNRICTSHYNCPDSYVCCPHDCYQHKVCVHAELKEKEQVEGTNVVTPHQDTPQYCPIPICEAMNPADERYMCQNDSMCPKNYKCCSEQCYPHKVCVKAVNYEQSTEIMSYRSTIPSAEADIYNINAMCPPKGTCEQKYKSEDTEHLKCYGNDNCKNGEYCCPDCRYGHNICRKSTTTTEDLISYTMDDNYCLIENKQCSLIPYKQSRYMECFSNNDCPEDYSCCADSCYTHKICKKRAIFVQPDYSMCPSTENCDFPISAKLTKLFKCNKNVKCALGEACCPSKCFGHNICKPIKKIERMPALCPVQDKCKKAFSMSLIKNLQCKTDSDCKENKVCCYDSCPKFKVCTDINNNNAISSNNYDTDKTNNNSNKINNNFDKTLLSQEDLWKEVIYTTCPIEELCKKEFSMSLMKKLQCENNKDCQPNNMCCHNTCAKFKICTSVYNIEKLNKFVEEGLLQLPEL